MIPEVKFIDETGIEQVEAAIAALDTVRTMCSHSKDLHHVSGEGMAWLLQFIVQGFEGAVQQQREDNDKASDLLTRRSQQLALSLIHI